MPIQIVFDRQRMSFDADTIRIGSDPENEVSAPHDTRLLPHHAVLKRINGCWGIESQSGATVRIGNSRPVRFSWLNAGDVIQLTEDGPVLTFEPPGSASPLSTTHLSATVETDSNSHLARAKQSETRAANKSHAIPQPRVRNRDTSKYLAVISILAPIALLFAFAGLFWHSESRDNSLPDVSDSNEQQIMLPPTTAPLMTPEPIDPQEFLVLVGFSGLKNDDNPHVLGVGWLWDSKTAVVPRRIGDAIVEIVTATQKEGSPRKGCIITGYVVDVSESVNPRECSEIAILRLSEPVNQSTSAREQWKTVNEPEVQRMLEQRKIISYVTYEPLPRPESLLGKHEFPLCEYDPDVCHRSESRPRLIFQKPQHFLDKNDAASRLERGGLLVDEERHILGMTLPDLSVVWTGSLERALHSQVGFINP